MSPHLQSELQIVYAFVGDTVDLLLIASRILVSLRAVVWQMAHAGEEGDQVFFVLWGYVASLLAFFLNDSTVPVEQHRSKINKCSFGGVVLRVNRS